MKFSEKNLKFESKEHEKAWLIRVTINLSKNVKLSAWNRKVVELDENIEFNTEEEMDYVADRVKFAVTKFRKLGSFR